ncbi:OadG family protein [Marinilabilia salmonicolor]|jgi:Na+-transporting methylmalonyl-CoA/oxaloacetate decarboxylase gamma subunit|uniref:Oxaloacetate decarboxylase gamma subunit n=1 Tax=Marinilabilia salmonicolor TaxID=989 RepID=A0A2T0XM77_9BACT|nr:OadG family protein [Marinilabilia salmonicolor]PRZ00049.1 oxaloacetate decarboxylase gamma subunit [Marinilabilia salmonicolor]RCW38646.1 oxaloacetate decarboxylase gamma subunit [Marinilabilia salmonicolor]
MSYLLDAVNWPQIWVITAVGYSVVFTALILLIFVFKFMPKMLNMQLKRRLKKEGKYVERTEGDEPFIAGEVNAAIGTALSLYFSDLHDDESKIITIKRVERRYSPWSSKIYNINNVLPTTHR